MRDHASLEQLLVLANIENMNWDTGFVWWAGNTGWRWGGRSISWTFYSIIASSRRWWRLI